MYKNLAESVYQNLRPKKIDFDLNSHKVRFTIDENGDLKYPNSFL